MHEERRITYEDGEQNSPICPIDGVSYIRVIRLLS